MKWTFYGTWSVYCIVCLLSKVKAFSIMHLAPLSFTNRHSPLLPRNHQTVVRLCLWEMTYHLNVFLIHIFSNIWPLLDLNHYHGYSNKYYYCCWNCYVYLCTMDCPNCSVHKTLLSSHQHFSLSNVSGSSLIFASDFSIWATGFGYRLLGSPEYSKFSLLDQVTWVFRIFIIHCIIR